jgi:hypothetical protein
VKQNRREFIIGRLALQEILFKKEILKTIFMLKLKDMKE